MQFGIMLLVHRKTQIISTYAWNFVTEHILHQEFGIKWDRLLTHIAHFTLTESLALLYMLYWNTRGFWCVGDY